MNVLPQELIDNIFEYIDIQTILNVSNIFNISSYTLKKCYKQFCIKFNNLYYGAQNKYYEKFIGNFDFKLDTIPIFEEIKCDYNLIQDKKIILTITEPLNIFFNNLELRVKNTLNKQFNEIIDEICIEIGGLYIISIYNSDYIEIYNKFFNIDNKIKYENNYIFIPLPFFNKETKNLLCNSKYHSICIICRFKNTHTKTLDKQLTLYGDKYNLKVTSEHLHFDQIIYQCQYTGIDTITKKENFYKYKMNYHHLVHLLFITSENDKPLLNIKKFILQFNNNTLEITLDQLNILNKNLGYNFKHPTFVFNPPINFSRIDNASLLIYFNENDTDSEKIVNVFGINQNSIKYLGGMIGLSFCG